MDYARWDGLMLLGSPFCLGLAMYSYTMKDGGGGGGGEGGGREGEWTKPTSAPDHSLQRTSSNRRLIKRESIR